MNSDDNNDNILELNNITVTYGSHNSLNGCSFSIRRREIHAVVGSKGSGKSTLVSVLSGAIAPKSGSIFFNGKKITTFSTAHSMKLGINTIYSDLPLYPQRTSIENVFLNREIRKFFILLDKMKMNTLLKKAFEYLKCDIDPEIPVRFYNKKIQQKIYIARLLCFESKLIIIDEISDKFSPEELENIHHLLSMLRKNGATILYISSDVEELYKFANRITFLKNGKVETTEELADINELKLVEITYSSLFKRSKLEKNNIELFYLNNFTKNILKNLPLSMIVTDSEDTIVFDNTQIGIKNSQPNDTKKNISIMNLFSMNSEQRNHLNDSLRKKIRCTLSEVQLLDINAGNQIVDLYIYPFYDDERSFIGTIYIWFTSEDRDDNFQKQIIDLNDRMNYTNSLTNIEHEINNPLEIISNYLHLIATSSTTEGLAYKTEIMRKEIKRIKGIIKKSISDGMCNDVNKCCNLHILMEEVIEFVKTNISGKEIYFSVNISNNIEIHADPDLLKQVLINIILNAIEAIKGNGTIEAAYSEKKRNSKTFSAIRILDNGVGLDKSTIDKIFDPFYSTKTGKDAHGLGLSISQDIAHKLGGFIEAESTPGEGSVLTVYLPTPNETTDQEHSQ